MSTKVDTMDNGMIKLTIEVSAEQFEKGMNEAYLKNRKSIQIPGFRKGKVPRKLVEQSYGKEIFYEDAANYCIPDAYEQALTEIEHKVVSRPEIDVVQIESGKPFIFTAEVAIKPEVELGEYKGLAASKEIEVVTEEEIKAELDLVRDKNARLVSVTDRPVQADDMAVIDFEGFIDGQAFDGGKDQDYELTIGSHSFIDDFEEQLIGKSVDEEVEVNVHFPADYQQADLAGKPALFKVLIKEIKEKELPELDDEFAMDVSDFDTLAEYKASIKADLEKERQEAADQKFKEQILEQAIENAKLDIPEPMLAYETEQMEYELRQNLQYQGMGLEQYLGYMGQSIEDFRESIKPQAIKRIKAELTLEAIAKENQIEISDEEVEAELQKQAEAYKMELDKIKEHFTEEAKEELIENLKIQKARDFVVDLAVVK